MARLQLLGMALAKEPHLTACRISSRAKVAAMTATGKRRHRTSRPCRCSEPGALGAYLLKRAPGGNSLAEALGHAIPWTGAQAWLAAAAMITVDSRGAQAAGWRGWQAQHPLLVRPCPQADGHACPRRLPAP